MRLYETTRYPIISNDYQSNFSKNVPVSINLDTVSAIYPKVEQAGEWGPYVEFTIFKLITGERIHCTELYENIVNKIGDVLCHLELN